MFTRGLTIVITSTAGSTKRSISSRRFIGLWRFIRRATADRCCKYILHRLFKLFEGDILLGCVMRHYALSPMRSRVVPLCIPLTHADGNASRMLKGRQNFSPSAARTALLRSIGYSSLIAMWLCVVRTDSTHLALQSFFSKAKIRSRIT